MGLLDGWWKSNDPLADLEPSLKKFLTQQAPRQYEIKDQATSQPKQSYREQLGVQKPIGPTVQQQIQQANADAQKEKNLTEEEEERPLPKESLFQDGRYKYLWKTYRPQQEREHAGKSDQEKLMDIVDSFKDRQAEVKSAAIENCSEEQWGLTDCFMSGGWKKRMNMCRDENRQFTRCVELQLRFLKAMGYMSMAERSEEESENMQMHADLLYHRMLDHEKSVAEAKEKGLPAPPLPPIAQAMPSPKDTPHFGKPFVYDDLPPPIQEKLKLTRFKGLEGFELELAKRELDQYIALNQDLVVRMKERYHEEYHERKQRYADGDERWGDLIKRYFDFRKYDETPPESMRKKANNSETSK